jgi:hypothetical protein
MHARSCDLAEEMPQMDKDNDGGADDTTDDGILEFRLKDSTSITGNCQSGYGLARRGEAGWAIQGDYLTPGEEAQLRDRAPHEGGVWIRDNVALQIARWYRDNGLI